MTVKRMWINQPSGLQPLHHLNGTNVLAVHEYDSTYRVYFLSGNKISQQADSLWLSEGWRPTQKLKDHEIREIVTQLSLTAKAYSHTQQLRDRIAQIIVPYLR